MASVPASIKSLRKLTRHPLDNYEAPLVFHHINKVEDREAAILAATALEHSLVIALAKQMVELQDPEHDDLFGGTAPLGSFAAKTKLAYALGTFGKKTRDELDAVRDIRNAFAHCQRPISFETREIKNVCNRLTIPERTPDLASFKGIDQPIDTSRKRYIAAIRLYQGALDRLNWPKDFGISEPAAPLD